MQSEPVQQELVGRVVSVQHTGHGPNSGEITIGILAQGAEEPMNVYIGIMPDTAREPAPKPDVSYAIEQGVYAAYMNMALTALTSGRKLAVSYVIHDKERVVGMLLRA